MLRFIKDLQPWNPASGIILLKPVLRRITRQHDPVAEKEVEGSGFPEINLAMQPGQERRIDGKLKHSRKAAVRRIQPTCDRYDHTPGYLSVNGLSNE